MADKLKGGLSDNMSLQDIATKHKVPLSTIEGELKRGMDVELEHTTDKDLAREIAMDHLYEDPKYYTKLKTIETESIQKSLRLKLFEYDDNKDYLKWKRNNVTVRGIKELGSDNNVYGSFGKGLYTAPLSNKAMAKGYGTVYFVVNAIPKKPKIVSSLNDAEIWRQKLVNDFCKKHDRRYDVRFFEENTTVEKEMLELGYDGLVIKGREMVNYTPPDNVKYYENENQLRQHYDTFVR